MELSGPQWSTLCPNFALRHRYALFIIHQAAHPSASRDPGPCGLPLHEHPIPHQEFAIRDLDAPTESEYQDRTH